MKGSQVNYKHLYYFWVTAREGSLTRAAERLGLSVQTVSEQVGLLERDLGRSLLAPQGRRLVPTEAGRVATGYADQIFLLGEQLREAMSDASLDRIVRLAVGVTDALPKQFAYRLVKEAFENPGHYRISCMEGEFDELLADLALHRLDVVMTDRPAAPSASLRVYNHVLGECPIGLFARPPLAKQLARAGEFPAGLDLAPILLPARTNALRSRIDQWFEVRSIRPQIVAEFEDSALMETVAAAGHGLLPAPIKLAGDLEAISGLVLVGELTGVREQFFAISNERKVRHPGVEAIIAGGAESLFGKSA
jgi:LysR family transcriptional regulator, transcriptional activator of nhaA